MKVLFRFFLSLSFLLLCGYTHICANSCDVYTPHPSVKIFERSQNSGHGITQNSLTCESWYTPSVTKKASQRGYIDEDEDESEKLTFLKKSLNATNYSDALNALASRYLFCRTKKRLPVSEFVLCCTSVKYILFRAIRIWYIRNTWNSAHRPAM